jgi:hypothetical protein
MSAVQIKRSVKSSVRNLEKNGEKDGETSMDRVRRMEAEEEKDSKAW